MPAAGDLAPPAVTAAVVSAGRRRSGGGGLTGVWSGAYSYPIPAPSVPFLALLTETAGALTGSIEEPNVYGDPAWPRLTATVDGRRAGDAVTFVKTMNGEDGQSHAITYLGTVNAEETRIEGTWIIPGAWSGTFFMERADAGESAAVERVEAVGA